MRKNYSSKFKADAVLEAFKETESLTELAGRLAVHTSMLIRWKHQAEKDLYLVFEDQKGDEKRASESQKQELYEVIGELTAQINWLKKKSGINV